MNKGENPCLNVTENHQRLILKTVVSSVQTPCQQIQDCNQPAHPNTKIQVYEKKWADKCKVKKIAQLSLPDNEQGQIWGNRMT